LEGEWALCYYTPVLGGGGRAGASKRDTSMQEPSPQKAHQLSNPTSSLRIHQCWALSHRKSHKTLVILQESWNSRLIWTEILQTFHTEANLKEEHKLLIACTKIKMKISLGVKVQTQFSMHFSSHKNSLS